VNPASVRRLEIIKEEVIKEYLYPALLGTGAILRGRQSMFLEEAYDVC
jgi:hypothetical protein